MPITATTPKRSTPRKMQLRTRRSQAHCVFTAKHSVRALASSSSLEGARRIVPQQSRI
jgi:hypothetical protein